MKSISENLMELKKEYNDTFVNISNSLKVHPTTISNYFRGKTIPSDEMIKRLAYYFRVPVSRIDESNLPENLVSYLGYDNVDQPSIHLTRVAHIITFLETYRKAYNLTFNGLSSLIAGSSKKLFNQLHNEYIRLIVDYEIPSDMFFEKVEKTLNITRCTFDICYVNGKEIDVVALIKHNLSSLLLQTNIEPTDIDKALNHPIGTFDELVTNSLALPPYYYLLDIADLFDIDITKIDPITDTTLCLLLLNHPKV